MLRKTDWKTLRKTGWNILRKTGWNILRKTGWNMFRITRRPSVTGGKKEFKKTSHKLGLFFDL